MADLVADIPERRQSLSDNFLRFPRRLRLGRREHDIDVAEGSQLPAAVSTQCRDNERFGEAFWNHGTNDAFEELFEEDVDQIRALARDFASAGARMVPHAQAMLFDLAKAAEDLNAFADAFEGLFAECTCGQFEGVFVGSNHRLRHAKR